MNLTLFYKKKKEIYEIAMKFRFLNTNLQIFEFVRIVWDVPSRLCLRKRSR